MEEVVLVDREDNKLGLMGKLEAHKNGGRLHRAFATFILNRRGDILLTQRSSFKPLWPLYWENTSSSHPRDGEPIVVAGQRRLREELGFTTSLVNLFSITYQADYNSRFSEHEVCAVLIGKFSGDIHPNRREVADIRWMDLAELRRELTHNGVGYAPWLRLAIEEIARNRRYLPLFMRRT